MKEFVTNWKTTISGVLVIATGITLVVLGFVVEGIGLVLAGAGLLMAKDGNVTGGTTTQSSKKFVK